MHKLKTAVTLSVGCTGTDEAASLLEEEANKAK